MRRINMSILSKIVLVTLVFISSCCAETILTYASWYSVASCKNEGTSGIMSNGGKLNDDSYTAASWDYKLGQRVKVTNRVSRLSCIVTITDRGPNKRLYRKGRRLDLSKAAFGKIANFKQGVIKVEVIPCVK